MYTYYVAAYIYLLYTLYYIPASLAYFFFSYRQVHSWLLGKTHRLPPARLNSRRAAGALLHLAFAGILLSLPRGLLA